MHSINSLTQFPSLIHLYLGSLFKGNSSTDHSSALTPPEISIKTQINPKQLQQYLQLCEIQTKSDTIPIFYPQVLAFRLHLLLLLNKSLPFPVMGLVHKFNGVQYLKPIHAKDTLELRVGLKNIENVEKGTDIHLYTHAYVNGILHWSAISTYFYRTPNKHSQPKTRQDASQIEKTHFTHTQTWSLKSNLGRQYARITGDLNPIHLFSLTAKLFGFKRTIIHGMYLAAKAANQVLQTSHDYPKRITLQFKRPVFLPSTLTFHYCETGFQLCSILEGNKLSSPMLLGKIETTESNTTAHSNLN